MILAIAHSVYSFKKADGETCFLTLKVCCLCNAVNVILHANINIQIRILSEPKKVPVHCILLVKRGIPKQYITY